MFISSYNTYINTNSSDRTEKFREDHSKDEFKSFNLKSLPNSTIDSSSNKNLPVDYVSNYKSFNNQQKLQEQIKSQDEIKYTKIKDIKNAKVAYEDNSKMFSLSRKPTASLDQTPKIDKDIPKSIQELKESELRHIMVNTYTANDKYYQLTA
ncbi:hypothetical protein HUE87_09815 [Candidatus Sulfurimonas marisnigri]|uniref:Uncharacterized protein n=1 Tax=Candidatus Sulfurimonas marisnigri TaxID=2740405 RepID=A0A7S7LZA7_9BACT|nr:hypothetical protein [Candidatus Sulfurimonas marisnigri]QOY54172.1 hypothetical protein HUE87_09815 [Candidatus Sulfurimonas marisnigri]